MKLGSLNMCDFCFEPIKDGSKCHKCGLSHETYKPSPGLLKPGANLMGKYIIGRALGRGGFGATYIAYSNDHAKAVAVKEYLPVSISYRSTGEETVAIVSEEKRDLFERGAKSFFEEAKTISKFRNNKNVVSVYEFFYANGTVYYSMEYLDGMDLKKYVSLNGGKLNQSKVLKIVREICNALISIHSTQTLHRDISPDNIFICSNGDVKLIDFGAAKQMVSEETQGYSVVLKQGFAPVEQYTRNGKQGVWTDIYALGATMYYALLGKIPPDAIDRVDNPEMKFDADVSLSPDLAGIIQKCMAYRIGDRYQSVIELLSDLDKLEVDEEDLLTNESELDDNSENFEQSIEETPSQQYDEPKTFGDSSNSKGVANRKNIIIIAAVLLVLGGLIVALAFGGGSSDNLVDTPPSSDAASVTSDADLLEPTISLIRDVGSSGEAQISGDDSEAQSPESEQANQAAQKKVEATEKKSPAKPKTTPKQETPASTSQSSNSNSATNSDSTGGSSDSSTKSMEEVPSWLAPALSDSPQEREVINPDAVRVPDTNSTAGSSPDVGTAGNGMPPYVRPDQVPGGLNTIP